MSVLIGVCRKALAGCGRESDRVYRNVLTTVQSSPTTWDKIIAHPAWSQPDHPEFAVQLTQEQFDSLQDSDLRFHGGHSNLPRVQVRGSAHGQTLGTAELGAFADPTDMGSAFVVGGGLSDDRVIVHVYDGGGTRLAFEALTQGAPGETVRRYIAFFEPSMENIELLGPNHVEIAGKQLLLEFDENAIAAFDVSIEHPGEVHFPTGPRYRVEGPNGEDTLTWAVYGRQLNVRR